MDQQLLQEFKADLSAARHPVFLTGAGVSTHSGIPDYRSKTGIYNGVSEPPETILSEDTLFNRPELFYSFVMQNMYFPEAKPNLNMILTFQIAFHNLHHLPNRRIRYMISFPFLLNQRNLVMILLLIF